MRTAKVHVSETLEDHYSRPIARTKIVSMRVNRNNLVRIWEEKQLITRKM